MKQKGIISEMNKMTSQYQLSPTFINTVLQEKIHINVKKDRSQQRDQPSVLLLSGVVSASNWI